MEKRVGTKKETLVRASNRSITAKDSKDIKTITEEIVFDDFIVKEFGSSIDIYTNDFPGVHATQSKLKSLSDNEMISNVIINVKIKVPGVYSNKQTECNIIYKLHNMEYPFGVKFNQSKICNHLLIVFI